VTPEGNGVLEITGIYCYCGTLAVERQVISSA
jgi:hypothetical protein